MFAMLKHIYNMGCLRVISKSENSWRNSVFGYLIKTEEMILFIARIHRVIFTNSFSNDLDTDENVRETCN
jgi:hypothetical protein